MNLSGPCTYFRKIIALKKGNVNTRTSFYRTLGHICGQHNHPSESSIKRHVERFQLCGSVGVRRT